MYDNKFSIRNKMASQQHENIFYNVTNQIQLIFDYSETVTTVKWT